MKLLNLYASNFKKLRFDDPLKFPDGITVVSGLNEAGKSTILDAILYALYGRAIRPSGHMKDIDIIGYGTGRATVILEFEITGHTYRVKREIHRNRANTANLYEVLPDGRLRPLATRVREVTDVIEKLLGGITFNEIVSSNVLAQKDLDRLVKEGSDRRKVINAFLNLESFNTVLENLNEERKDLEGTGPSRPGMINVERGNLEKLQSELKEFNQRKAEITDLQGKIEKLCEEVEGLESKHKELESLHKILTRYDEAMSLKKQLTIQLGGKKEILKNQKAELNSLTQQIQRLESDLTKYANLPSDETISEIQTMLGNLRESDRQITEAEERAKEVAEEIKRLEEQLQGFGRKELENARKTRISLKPYVIGTVVSFAIGFIILLFAFSIPILTWIAVAVMLIGAVPLVAKFIARQIQINKLAKLEGLLGKAELLDGKSTELSKLKNEASYASKKFDSIIQSLTQALEGLQHYEMLIKQAKSPKLAAESVLSQFSKDKQEKDNLDSGIRNLKSSLDAATKRVDVSKVQLEIDGLEEQIAKIEMPQLPDGIEFSKELLASVSREKEDVKGGIEGCKATIKNHTERIEENRRYIEEHKDIEQNVKSQEKVVQDLEHKLRVVRVALSGIEKTAEMLRMRVRPSVESYMGQILPSITSGRYKAVMLDEAFGLQVWDPEAGEFRPKEVFSGGTEDQFLLAMRLAFALALMPEVKGTKPDFLFLDEPLGSSDEVRRSGIIEYLNIGLSKLFSQIFIISHVGGLEELVPNVIRLDNGRVMNQ